MDLVHKMLNIVLPLATLISLLLILPPYLVFNLVRNLHKEIHIQRKCGWESSTLVITGASSGIGEGLAYEYGRRGARLALVARREDRLKRIAAETRELGSPDVLVIPADIANIGDCRRLVDETMNHFGQLDHLVNNAGTTRAELFEDSNPSDSASVMDVNFWGLVNCTHLAIPHLRKSKGKIVVISSVASWSPAARGTLYNASKAALVGFYETLRVECGSHIGITIVLPGLIESEMTLSDAISKLDAKFLPPMESTKRCVEAIVKSVRRGDKHLTEGLLT